MSGLGLIALAIVLGVVAVADFYWSTRKRKR